MHFPRDIMPSLTCHVGDVSDVRCNSDWRVDNKIIDRNGLFYMRAYAIHKRNFSASAALFFGPNHKLHEADKVSISNILSANLGWVSRITGAYFPPQNYIPSSRLHFVVSKYVVKLLRRILYRVFYYVFAYARAQCFVTFSHLCENIYNESKILTSGNNS